MIQECRCKGMPRRVKVMRVASSVPMPGPWSVTARRGENTSVADAPLGRQENPAYLPAAAIELRSTELGQRKLATPPELDAAKSLWCCSSQRGIHASPRRCGRRWAAGGQQARTIGSIENGEGEQEAMRVGTNAGVSSNEDREKIPIQVSNTGTKSLLISSPFWDTLQKSLRLNQQLDSTLPLPTCP